MRTSSTPTWATRSSTRLRARRSGRSSRRGSTLLTRPAPSTSRVSSAPRTRLSTPTTSATPRESSRSSSFPLRISAPWRAPRASTAPAEPTSTRRPSPRLPRRSAPAYSPRSRPSPPRSCSPKRRMPHRRGEGPAMNTLARSPIHFSLPGRRRARGCPGRDYCLYKGYLAPCNT